MVLSLYERVIFEANAEPIPTVPTLSTAYAPLSHTLYAALSVLAMNPVYASTFKLAAVKLATNQP